MGHTVIHWYQQMFPIFLPFIRADLGLSEVQVGGLMSAKQGASGLLTLPSGFAADAFNKHKAVILGSALAMGGCAYLVASIAPTYFWVLTFLVMLPPPCGIHRRCPRFRCSSPTAGAPLWHCMVSGPA